MQGDDVLLIVVLCVTAWDDENDQSLQS